LRLTATHCRSAEIEFLKLGSAVTFFKYGALLKYNRIGEIEMMCSVAGILASIYVKAVA
jgi:hypothetical protein